MGVVVIFYDNPFFNKKYFLTRFNFSHLHGILKGGVIICFVICWLIIYFCRDGNVWMGACGPEHADGSMPTGRCNRKVRKRIIICFVVCLRTRICMGMESCRREHAKGSMWMWGCGWEHGDRSIVTGAIFFWQYIWKINDFWWSSFFHWHETVRRGVIICFVDLKQTAYFY
jgi:hypothetical protein